MPDHEVAIVGAGPVGLLLACLLAQTGVDVGVYERRPDSDDRSRAIGIHPPGKGALDAAGLGTRVKEEALELEGGEVICGGRILAALSFARYQRVLVLPQRRTHALLIERLSHLPSATLFPDHEVRDVRNEGEQVRLALHTAGVSREVTAKFVVAADGVHSGIREQLGIGWRPQSGSGSYAMVDAPHDQPGQRVQLHCEPAGLVEVFPLPEGQRRWVVADLQRTLGDRDAFVAAIRQRTDLRLELPSDRHPTMFRAQQHRASRLTAGRVVLLGDAAHETSPIGGQGMNLGWAAAHQLSAALEHAVRSGRAEFREYERHAERAAARAQQRSAFYMSMGRPAAGPTLAVRNAVIRLLGTAPLRARTANMITMKGT